MLIIKSLTRKFLYRCQLCLQQSQISRMSKSVFAVGAFDWLNLLAAPLCSTGSASDIQTVFVWPLQPPAHSPRPTLTSTSTSTSTSTPTSAQTAAALPAHSGDGDGHQPSAADAKVSGGSGGDVIKLLLPRPDVGSSSQRRSFRAPPPQMNQPSTHCSRKFHRKTRRSAGEELSINQTIWDIIHVSSVRNTRQYLRGVCVFLAHSMNP